MLTKEASPAD